MRRRIGWLVGATTSAVILAFVIPLCLLVRTLAEDRAMGAADQEARNVAILVSGLHEDPRLGELVEAVDRRSQSVTSVLGPGGEVLGTPSETLGTDPEVIRARAGSAFTDKDSRGGRVLIPVDTEDGTFVVRTTVDAATLHRGVTRAWVGIVTLGAVLIVAALAIADRLARRVSTPVTDLAGVALKLKDGDLDARAVPAGPPETVELGDALNQLAERVTELLAAERAQVGDLSHRLRTPVTALRLDAEAMGDSETSRRLQGHIAQLQRTIDAIVQDARRPVRHNMASSCDAAAVVAERMTFWGALAEDQGRPLDVRVDPAPVPVGLDPADLAAILDVLVDNVFAHTPDDTGFEVAVGTRDGLAEIRVVDAGPGLSPPPDGAARPGTTGLGLEIVRRTAAAVGGEMTADAPSGRGTRVTVRLPLVGAAPPPRG